MPTGYARASTDDHSLSLQRDLIPLGGTPDAGMMGVQEVSTGPGGGRLAFHLRT